MRGMEISVSSTCDSMGRIKGRGAWGVVGVLTPEDLPGLETVGQRGKAIYLRCHG